MEITNFNYINYLKLNKINYDIQFKDFKKIAKNDFELNNNSLISKKIKLNNKFLNFSPDFISNNNELIDIYVNINNNNQIILNNIEMDYNMYIQILLNLLNLNSCIVYYYQFIKYNNSREMRKTNSQKYGIIINNKQDIYWKISHIKKIIINRVENTNTLNSLNKIILKNNYNYMTKKRKYIDNNWVAASKTRNYSLNDPCLDYFRANNLKDISNKKIKMSHNFEPSSKIERIEKRIEDADSFIDFLLIKGNVFESQIIDVIKNKFKDNFIKICDPINSREIKYYNNTIKEMKKLTPIIYQAVLYNFKYKTFGCVDLLVRSDYINKICNENVISEDEINIKSDICEKYHYRVIDIKYSKLHFNSDFETIRNSNNIKPYKSQLAIYNLCLGEMQGYLPNKSYILGKGWHINRVINKEYIDEFNDNPFNKLGVIDYTKKDNFYYDLALDAVDWIKEININDKLEHDPPNDYRLYPNMCNNYDGIYHNIKKQISDKYNEITNIWNCGVNNRNKAFEKNIYNWKDNRCNSDTLEINGKNKIIIDKMLDFNRQSDKIINIQKIDNNYNNWRDDNLSFFLDFETISDILEIDIVYMIGIGWILPNSKKWNYKCFYVKSLNIDEEKNIFENSIKHIENLQEKYNIKANIYHWSNAEITHFNRLRLKYKKNIELKWFDLLKFFKDNNILILGSLNFSLKTIVKSMKKYNLINSFWNDSCVNGLDAMFFSWKEYIKYKNINDSSLFKEIIKYNEIDCKVLFEILNYFKKNH